LLTSFLGDRLFAEDWESLSQKRLSLVEKNLQEFSMREVSLVTDKLSEDVNIESVLQKIAPKGCWLAKQAKFAREWKTKDYTEFAKTLKPVNIPFFTAWGNFQNYTDINFYKIESQFDYRQVLVSEMDYNWREKFKPSGNIVLTINYGISSIEIKALLELINENKNKIKLIVLPWGQFEMNNFDNRNVSTYPEIAEWCDKLFFTIKEVAPDIPVYLTVCLTHETVTAWIKAFKAPYDGLNLWNITNTNKANLGKAYQRVKAYNKNVILGGVFQCSPAKFVPFSEAKKITFDTYHRAKDAGFRGVILLTNEVE